jgi:hypothetical protein
MTPGNWLSLYRSSHLTPRTMTLNDNERLESKSALLHAPALSPLKDLQEHFSESTKGQIKNLTKYFASTQAQQESRKRYLSVTLQ